MKHGRGKNRAENFFNFFFFLRYRGGSYILHPDFRMDFFLRNHFILSFFLSFSNARKFDHIKPSLSYFLCSLGCQRSGKPERKQEERHKST